MHQILKREKILMVFIQKIKFMKRPACLVELKEILFEGLIRFLMWDMII